MEIPPPCERHAEHAVQLRLTDPAAFASPRALDRFWEPVHMVANLPHLRACFTAASAAAPGPTAAAAPDGSGARAGSRQAVETSKTPTAVGGPVAVAPPRPGGGGGAPAAAAATLGGLAEGNALGGGARGGGGREGGTQSALFMLDSGAGGVDVMFHERASLSFGLLEAAGVKTRYIRVCATLP